MARCELQNSSTGVHSVILITRVTGCRQCASSLTVHAQLQSAFQLPPTLERGFSAIPATAVQDMLMPQSVRGKTKFPKGQSGWIIHRVKLAIRGQGICENGEEGDSGWDGMGQAGWGRVG